METIVLKDKKSVGMTVEEFLWFCLENKDLRIERNHNLEIIIMSPVTSLSGFHSLAIARQLANWAIADNTGIAFDSSTGFSLPDRSVLSPDASWVSNEKWNALSEEDKDRFAPVCPELVIEVRSKSDSLDDLKKKMEMWIKNGAHQGWLIDPREKTSYIFRTGKVIEVIVGLDKKIEAEGLLKGFVLDLNLLKI